MTRRSVGAWLALLLTVLVSFACTRSRSDRLLNAAKERGTGSCTPAGISAIATASSRRSRPPTSGTRVSWMYQQRPSALADHAARRRRHHVSHAAANDVVALDAKTGACSGSTGTRDARQIVCCGANNRGLAILGDTLYMGSLTHTWSRSTRRAVVGVEYEGGRGQGGIAHARALAVKDKSSSVSGRRVRHSRFVARTTREAGGKCGASTRFPRRANRGAIAGSVSRTPATFCDPDAWKHGGAQCG